MMGGEKYCSKCDKYKPIDLFYKNKSQHDGLSFYCIPCVKKTQKRYRKKKTYIEKANERQSKYNANIVALSTDAYINKLLTKGTGIPNKAIPESLTAAKRAQLQIKRLLKEQNQ